MKSQYISLDFVIPWPVIRVSPTWKPAALRDGPCSESSRSSVTFPRGFPKFSGRCRIPKDARTLSPESVSKTLSRLSRTLSLLFHLENSSFEAPVSCYCPGLIATMFASEEIRSEENILMIWGKLAVEEL